MPSNKLRPRRNSHDKPKICRSKPPKPPKPDSPPASPPSAPPTTILARYHFALTLPARPSPPFRPIETTNCICHLYPHAVNASWLMTLHYLNKFRRIFNGRILFAIAEGPDLFPASQIVRLLPTGSHYFTLPNHARRREVASYLPLLEEIRTTDPLTATFYCHSKGASMIHWGNRDDCAGLPHWTQFLYVHNLGRFAEIRRALETHAMAGVLKLDYSSIPGHNPQSPSGLIWGPWHYAGAFYWYRHDYWYLNPEWSAIPDDAFSAELHPANVVPTHLAAGLTPSYDAHSDHLPALYSPETWPLDLPPHLQLV